MLWPNCPTCPAQIAPFTARTLAPRPHRPGCPRPPARAALAGRKPVVRPWIRRHLSSGDGVFAGSGTRRRAVVPAVRVHAGRRERLPSQRAVPVARRRAVERGGGRPLPGAHDGAGVARVEAQVLGARRRRGGADAAGAPPAVGLPPAAQGAAAGAGRAGWRLALEFEVVGLPPGSALAEAPPETAGADIVAEAPPAPATRSHARACASPRAAAAGRRRRAAPPPAAVPQLLAATTRLLQEQVLNSGGRRARPPPGGRAPRGPPSPSLSPESPSSRAPPARLASRPPPPALPRFRRGAPAPVVNVRSLAIVLCGVYGSI